jgi:hypothetical protein
MLKIKPNIEFEFKGMAKYQNKQLSPNIEIEVSQAFAYLMEAFSVNSKKIIKSLVNEALKAIYGGNNSRMVQFISKDELDSIIALMKVIDPKNDLEKLYAVQIIVCYILGIRKLAEKYKDDKKIGLVLLKLQNETIQNLISMQCINTQ